MKSFVDVEPQITERVVIVDLDGTLVPDGSSDVSASTAAALRRLSSRARVYLLSNEPRGRVARLADEYGVHAITTSFKKPSPKTLIGIELGDSVSVVGDKYLTDGLLAVRTRSHFYKVDHLVNGSESVFTTLSYAVDKVASIVLPALELMRPWQWIKNALIFVPAFFAGVLIDAGVLWQLVLAFISFSAAASIGYIRNDLVDVAADRAHTEKRFRPLARGALSRTTAYASILVLCGVLALAISAQPLLLVAHVIYILASVLYSEWLKRIPIVELVVVALFYNARVIVGGVAASVAVSEWLHVSVFFAALFLVAGKRYGELGQRVQRGVLAAYPREFLQSLPVVAATLTLVAYSLYAITASSVEGMVYTVPLAVIGVLAYLAKVLRSDGVESPERALFRDRTVRTVLVLWCVLVTYLYYIQSGILSL